MIRPFKALGQHYLVNQDVVEDIVSLVNYDPGMKFIEIGPGTGNLTRALRHRVKDLTCIELDQRFEPVQGVDWVYGSALDYQYTVSDYVIGNLPYNISVPMLVRCAEASVKGWLVMVQKEVAERIVAREGKAYGSLSLLLQSRFDVKLEFVVPPKDFYPMPSVHSAVISAMRVDSRCDMKRLEFVTAQLFKHRRKQLCNVLPKGSLLDRLTAAGISLTARVSEIPREVIYELVNGWE